MNQIKIIASSISNLTDARYFAAWGVDALSFDFDKVDRDEYFAILDWVEGVKIYVETREEFSDLEIHEADGIIYLKDDMDSSEDILSGNTIVSGSLALLQSISFKEGQILRIGDQWASWNLTKKQEAIQFAKKHNCFLDIPLALTELEAYLKSDLIYGLVLRGGEEEKVGFKSFDELEEVFELLEE